MNYKNGEDKTPALQLLFGEQAAQPPPADDTIVEGILHLRAITLVYGKPKSGKSFLATDLARAVADSTRAAWMDYKIRQHGPILYVACEGHGGFWKRLQAGGPVPDNFVLARGRPKLIVNPDAKGYAWVPHPDDIKAAVNQIETQLGVPPIAIFIDTVFRSFGGGNVNDSSHMNAYVAAAQELADQETAVVLIHHATKAASSPAGSVALMGGADNLILVQKLQDGTHSFEVEEAKDDPSDKPRAFTLDIISGIEDANGELVASCTVIDQGIAKPETIKKRGNAANSAPETKQRNLSIGATAVLNAITSMTAENSGNVTRDELRDHLRQTGIIGEPEQKLSARDRDRLRNWISDLVARGKIEFLDTKLSVIALTNREA